MLTFCKHFHKFHLPFAITLRHNHAISLQTVIGHKIKKGSPVMLCLAS